MGGNSFTTLPAGVFSDLTNLYELDLSDGALSSLPAGVFSGQTALTNLLLDNNALTSQSVTEVAGLTSLQTLWLHENDLEELPDGLFSRLTSLTDLKLSGNDLEEVPDGAFSGLTSLGALTLGDNPDTGNTLTFTVRVEKVGTDQVRAKVLAGAPFEVDFTPTLANGSLPASDTKLAVPKGSVDGTAVTVTRTSGTMAAVTVDIDLTTQPSLPATHSGYTFAKAAGSEPVEILPDTRGPQNLTAAPGDGQAVLAWDAPPSGSGVTKHQYHFKTTGGSYPTSWTDIPNSAVGEANEDGYTVPNLTNETAYTFELRWLVGASGSATAESNTVTPTPGICDRTQEVYEAIVEFYVAGTDNCAAVTVADLAAITELDLSDLSIDSLKSGDLAGLTNVVSIGLTDNRLTTLPEDVFSGLTTLRNLRLDQNDLTSLPAGLTSLHRQDNDDVRWNPGLTATVNLQDNDLTSLPDGVFTGLTSLGQIALQDNNLTSLPAGVFTGLTSLEHLSLGGNPDNGDTLPLTVTLEKVGDDGVRAKVLAAAPFAVDFTATVANGTLDGNATALSVTKGSVESSAVTVTRTEGTTDAVTVDIDLTTQPALPSSHTGYEFAKATGSEPVEILPEEATIDPPTDFDAVAGADQEAVLSWTPPPANSGYTRHEYRYKAGNGSFTSWTEIPDSGPGGANASGYTVTGLGGLVEHTFELRAASDDGRSRALTARVTPTGDAVVTLHLSDDKPLENTDIVEVTATVTPATPVDFTVAISASPVAPATDDDFTLSANRTLSFAAGATESTGTVTIRPIDNEDPEPPDVVRVSGDVSNAAIADPDDVTFTIVNDDSETFDVAVSAPKAVDETAATVAVTYTLTTEQNSPPVAHTELYYQAESETATSGVDYTPPPGQVIGSLVLLGTVRPSAFSPNAAGTAWVAERSFAIGIVDDRDVEKDETIRFRVEAGVRRSPRQTIVIRDDDATELRNVTVINGPGADDGVWSAGEQVELEVRYNYPVEVVWPEDCWSYNADGTCKPSGPYVAVVFRDDEGKYLSTALAPYESGSGTDTLRFAYTVGEDEDGALRVSAADDGILLRGATIRPLGDGDVKPSYTNTRVLQVTVPTSGRAWTVGEKVRVEVRFSGPGQQKRDKVEVDKTGGTPTIGLKLGDRADRTLARRATYVRGSGSDTLEFEYEVTAGDGGRGRDPGLRGETGRGSGRGRRDGGLPHAGRHGGGGLRLHGEARHAEVRPGRGRVREDGVGADRRRRGGGRRGDVQAVAEQRDRRGGRELRGGGHDSERRGAGVEHGQDGIGV